MENGKPLSALHVPVEIFVLFLIQNKRDFKVQDVIDQMNEVHKVDLSYKRVKQILDGFTDMGKLTMEMRPNGVKNKVTAYYTFNKIT